MSNMMHQRTTLATGWTFKRTPDPDSSFLPCAQFPTCIHLDLLHHKLIPDPLLDDNETEVQWVGEEEWTYRTTFTVPNIPPLIDKASRHAVTSTGKTELVFDGLDTFCTVLLNGKTILTTENMYVAHRVDVTTALQLGENVLELRFGAAFLIGRKLEKEAGGPPLFCHNGDSSRLQVRKAPYSYGWDW
jgi:beta-mannosidase